MVNISMSKYKKINRKKAIWAMNAKLENHYTIEDIFFEIRRQEAREEGIKKGREEGIKKGREEGKKIVEEKAKKELIEQMLSLKYHVDASTWVSSLSSNQLNQVPAFILTCDTFDEFQNQINHIEP